jgi:antitoxin component YwqK of YwqJK toxin-antitoxin module
MDYTREIVKRIQLPCSSDVAIYVVEYAYEIKIDSTEGCVTRKSMMFARQLCGPTYLYNERMNFEIESIVCYLFGDVFSDEYDIGDRSQSIMQEGENIKIMKHEYGRIQEQYTIDYWGRRTGQYMNRYQNGLVATKCNYLNGELHGDFKTYRNDIDNEIKVHYKYQYGLRHGIQKEYHSLFVKTKTSYYKGVKHGPEYEYDFGNVLRTRRMYSHGLKHGVEITVNDVITHYQVYKMGIKHGPHFSTNINESLTCNYNEGLLDGEHIVDDYGDITITIYENGIEKTE